MPTQPTCGHSGHVDPAVSGVSTAERGDKNQKSLHGPHVGIMATSPLPSQLSATLSAGTKITNAHMPRMWAKWLHHPSRLGGPQRSAQREQLEMPTEPTCGQSGHITLVVAAVPYTYRRDKKIEVATWPTCEQSGYITPTVWGSPTLSEGRKDEKCLHGPHVGKGHKWAK